MHHPRSRQRRSALARMVLLCLLAMVIPACMATSRSDADAQLRDAASRGDARAVRKALDAGADLEARDGQGRTALLLATHGNSVDAARELIEAGADVNAKDAMQDSAYLYAGARGLDEILALTLAHGADLRSTNRYGGTALIPAAERGHVATVRTLLRAGVAVDHVNRLHWTALLEAILLGDGGPRQVQIVQLLLDAGANPELADGDGVTPLAHAKQRGYTNIETLLRQHGATR
ncbi:ankyrin repeat domain-containing protein [Stenotrophomonas sp. C1657]|uniref:ankyrin repeat domain-containing protein n=1 Tax=Stenotrophomonas sp. C1657 TaxID=3077844 RepID=UPI00293C4CB7|nr:ankyrin repeat domain-containing protein [Stenotrophomonas sp. C1657]MDV3516519.1 ankyrin repeat domain-containing protein [Stenotrophomonas sp. C1657]